MKHDPYFKYLAAVIAAGVLLAIIDPAPLPANSPDTTASPVSLAANR